jgi:hypothetical protein
VRRIEKNSDQDVADATLKAFLLVEKLEALPHDGGEGNLESQLDLVNSALKEVSALFGIGPATASAVLSLRSSRFFFMSDEVLEFLLYSKAGQKCKYNVVEYKLLYVALAKTALRLNREQISNNYIRELDVENSDKGDGQASGHEHKTILDEEQSDQDNVKRDSTINWSVRNVHDALWSALFSKKMQEKERKAIVASKSKSNRKRKHAELGNAIQDISN